MASESFSFRAIVKSAFSNWFGLLANVLIVLCTTPYIIHHLGSVSYGIWALALQITGYLGIFDAGVRSSVVRFVAKHTGENNEDAVTETISVAVIVHSFIGLVGVAVAALVAVFGVHLLHVSHEMLGLARTTIFIAGLTIAISFPFGVYVASLVGLGRYAEKNVIEVAFVVLRTAVVIGALMRGHGLIALALIQLVCTALSGATSAAYLYKLLPFVHIRWTFKNVELIRQMFSHSLYALLISAANRLNYEVDSIVIAAFLPIEEVTFYFLGFRLLSYLRDFANATTQVAIPLTSRLSGPEQGRDLHKVLNTGSKYTLLVTYPITIVLLFCGGDFLTLWVGPSYAKRALPVLIVLAVTQFFSLTQYIPTHMLYGSGKHRMNVWCTAIEGIINLGASILLVRPFGITGVALGTAISVVSMRGIVFPILFAKLFNTTARAFVREAVLPLLVPSVISSLALYLLRRGMTGTSWPRLLLEIVVGLVCFALPGWLITLNGEDRQRFRGLLRHGARTSDAVVVSV